MVADEVRVVDDYRIAVHPPRSNEIRESGMGKISVAAFMPKDGMEDQLLQDIADRLPPVLIS